MGPKIIKKTIYLCLAESLEQNGTGYIQLLKSVREELSEESVHEIRVTIRKLEACLELLDTLALRHKNLTKDLKHIRKIHGPLRNMHVELESIKSIEDRIQSKPFKHFLKGHEKKFEKKLQKELDRISLDKQQKEIQKIVEKLLQKDVPTMNEKALKAMETQNQKVSKEFEKTKRAFSPNSPNSPKSIHAIRIAAKRLRYQSEILKPVISFDNVNLRQLKHFQDIFGKIQNNNVLQQSIDKFLHKHSRKGSKSVLEVQTYIAKEQQTLMNLVGKMKGMKFSQSKKKTKTKG